MSECYELWGCRSNYANLSFRKMDHLPYEIYLLENLTELDLSNNKLKSIPPQIAYLTNLKKLDLKNNELTEFPSQTVKLLTNLETLILSVNPNLKLPKDYNNQLSSLATYVNEKTVANKTITMCVLTNKFEDFQYFSSVFLANVSIENKTETEMNIHENISSPIKKRRFLSLETKNLNIPLFDSDSEDNIISQEQLQEITIKQINKQKFKRNKETKVFKDKWYKEIDIPEFELKLKIQVIYFTKS